MIKVLSITFLMVFIFSCGKDELINIQSIADLDTYLQDEMDAQHIPALSCLIFHQDSILYERNYGKSQLEQDISLESDHLFLLASVSKVITATALLRLYEQGLFELDDRINDYLDYDVSVPGKTTDITFRMLLTHTSAIADGSAMDDQYYYGVDPAISLDYYMENYLVPGGEYYNSTENFYNFEPGTKYKYSNEGYALIGVLVEQIAHEDFNDYCREQIFEPLGMDHTFWRLDEIASAGYFIVQPYDWRHGRNKAIEHYTFTDYPNGALRSTSMDLYRFLRAFTLGGESGGYQLLHQETIDEMTTLQIPDLDNEMGLNLFRLNRKNNLWGHDGGEAGVSTIMAFNPQTKSGVILLANQGDAYLDDMLVEAYKLGITLQ